MQQVAFKKVHGSGNDFVMLDATSLPADMDDDAYRRLTAAVCDRDGPIGADGLMLLWPDDPADLYMRLFNADGSEASLCGNGIRCVGREAMVRTGRETATVRTIRGQYRLQHVEDLCEGVFTVRVGLGAPSFRAADLPLAISEDHLENDPLPALGTDLLFTAVAMPNPHLVAVVDAIDTGELVRVGTAANAGSAILPDGANVNFAYVVARDRLFVRTFERGVGLTNACGSGMTAAAVVAVQLGRVDADCDLEVVNDGGFVRVRVDQTPEGLDTYLTGNATIEYAGTVTLDAGGRLQAAECGDPDPEEAAAYARVREKAKRLVPAL